MATQYGNFGQGSSSNRKQSLALQAQGASPYAPSKIQTGVSTGNAKKPQSGPKKQASPMMPGQLTNQQWNDLQMKKAADSIQQQVQNRPADPTEVPSTPFDGLAALLASGGAGGRVDTSQYDQQSASTQAAGNAADAKLQAMYAQLSKSYADDQGGIAAQYAATRGNQAQAADDAANSINNAYNASNASLTDTLKNLGIGDAAKVIANNGTSLQNGQAQALAGVQANKAANLSATDARGGAAQDYTRQIADAASLEGTTQRAANQQQLQKALSQIAAARTSAVNSATAAAQPSFSDALALAKAQADYQSSQAKSASSAAQQKFNNQLQLQKIATAVNGNNNANNSAKSRAYAALLKQYGGDKKQATADLKALGF